MENNLFGAFWMLNAVYALLVSRPCLSSLNFVNWAVGFISIYIFIHHLICNSSWHIIETIVFWAVNESCCLEIREASIKRSSLPMFSLSFSPLQIFKFFRFNQAHSKAPTQLVSCPKEHQDTFKVRNNGDNTIIKDLW